MKATITFNYDLDEPSERKEIQKLINYENPLVVLDALKNHLRDKLKYYDLTDEQQAVYEEIQKFLFEEASENNVEI